MATSSRKHRIAAVQRDTPPKVERGEQGPEQGETSHGLLGQSLPQALVRSSPWRALSSIAVATASMIGSPSRVAPRSPAAAASAAAPAARLQPRTPRQPDFGSAVSVPTLPTALVGTGHAPKLLRPGASMSEVASFLCGGEHSFEVGVSIADSAEEAALPRRALEWRQHLEARLGALSCVRRNQAHCMAAMLLGRDTVHLAPTGSGKTLCFELPALTGGLVVVISPLRSLIRSQCAAMQSQLDKLGAGGTARHELSSFFVKTDSEAVKPDVDAAKELVRLDAALVPGTLAHAIVHDSSLRILYLTPEKLGNHLIAAALAKAAPSLYVVDEAHCLVDWNEWRLDYDEVGVRLNRIDERRHALREAADLPLLRPPRHVCTATATPTDLDDIVRVMKLRDPERITCAPELFARANLHLMVHQANPDAEEAEAARAKAVGAPLEGPTQRAACVALRRFYDVSAAFDDTAGGAGCGIIYVRWAGEADGVAAAISRVFEDKGVRAASFLGTGTAKTEEQDAVRRRSNDDALAGFNSGAIEWLVATCVLGMGVEFEREVTAVVHLGFPPSADDYQQEIGRGGRRGGRCDCLLYASLPMAHRTVTLLAKQREGEVRMAVTRRLERFQELLGVLFSERCRRDALLTAVLGPELACRCPACKTCDRCCSSEAGCSCCEMTAGCEEEHDLRDAAQALWCRLVRQPRALQHCSAAVLWRGLPAAVAMPSGCTQLVLLMLARGLLYLEPDGGGRDGPLVCARKNQLGLEAMRRSPLRSHVAAPTGAVPDDATVHGAALLDRLLEELRVMERCVAQACAEMEALRRRCIRVALQLGRTDLLERRN